MRNLVRYTVIIILTGTVATFSWWLIPIHPAPILTPIYSSELQSGTIQLEASQVEQATKPSRAKSLNQPAGLYIVIDRYCNQLFLRTKDSVYLEAFCSTGSGSELVDSVSGRQWKFVTPAGAFIVNSKLVNPWWRKPDWAFIEEGEPIPIKENLRYDDQMMGDYAIGFGDGYFIHGTIYERLIGKAVTHGCVRMRAQDLAFLYENTKIGTRIYVF